MSKLGGIFGLFGFPEGDGESPYGKRENDDSLSALKETPHFKVGMFCKMINNGNNFTKQLLGFFKTSKDHIDMSGVNEIGEMIIYNRALAWIQECDLEKDEWKLALHEHKDKGIVKCLVETIKFYESTEEYETCAFLKELQNCIEETYP